MSSFVKTKCLSKGSEITTFMAMKARRDKQNEENSFMEEAEGLFYGPGIAD